MEHKKGQISSEYMIILGFVVFLILSVSAIAFLYSSSIKERVSFDRLDNFARDLISSSESVYYYGEPSLETVELYLPPNVKDISFINKSVVFTVSTSTGENKLSYESRVNLEGNITFSAGIKVIKIQAKSDGVQISE